MTAGTPAKPGTPGTLRVASAQYAIEPVADFDAWYRKQAQLVASAADGGAQLLVLPEYSAVELSACLPEGSLAEQLAGLQALWPAVIEAQAALAKQHRIWLLGGTLTERIESADRERREYRNRARLYAPSGALYVQDKLQMTRFEREEWGISPGDTSAVLDTPLGKLGIAICYDVEFPLIVRRLVAAGAELVLVPSCTDTLAGYYRVSLSARARALENQCYVVHAVTVGSAPWSQALDENRGAAAVYCPVDRGFADDGIVAQGVMDVPSLVFANLELEALARVRAEGQVWNHRDWDLPNHLETPVTIVPLR